VLDLSKVEAGHITLDEKNFDLYHLLDDLYDIFYLKANHKHLQLHCERDDDVPQFIRADEVRLRQVLINLLSNALRFTEEGGITLKVMMNDEALPGKVGMMNKGLKPDIHHSSFCILHFEVKDTGLGIAPDEMDALFEVFAQTASGRQVQGGTGLGLPLSRKFVQMMGGDISVQSEVGHGTTFTFDIQGQIVGANDVDTQRSQRRVIALAPNQPHYRLLIVDDDETNRQLLAKLLTPLGFDLQEAENGQQVLEIWETYEPHLIWMDMRMPVIDGYEATQQIKATTKGQATAIVALTASGFEEQQAVVLSVGCDDFVRKPFQETEIFEVMSKHIGVQYVYEDITAGSQPSRLGEEIKEDLKAEIKKLPPELIATLTKAAYLCDMELIDQAIAEIRGHHTDLAEALAKLTGDFKYNKILALIQQHD
jgi:CheY-like chemotaxis protein